MLRSNGRRCTWNSARQVREGLAPLGLPTDRKRRTHSFLGNNGLHDQLSSAIRSEDVGNDKGWKPVSNFSLLEPF